MPSKRRIETIQYLTSEEMKALLAAIRREIRAKSASPRADTRRNVYRDHAVFTLAYRYGLRAEEVGRLRMADHDASARKLFVTRVKSGVSRHYPLYDDELTVLRAHLRRCDDDSPEAPLFPSNRGTGIDRKMLHVLMRRYGGMAGIPVAKQHFHALRHTCAVHLLDMGQQLVFVQDWLGHTHIENTRVYAKISDKNFAERARMASGAFQT
jgi:integrase